MHLTLLLAGAVGRQRIQRVLIANRGEIALRVMRTARRLGVETVAVYSDPDVTAQHVKHADYAVRIGEASALSSYLNATRIVEEAERVGAQAIHPGYGFLSENHEFAALCEHAGLKFIGPSAEAIKAMGQKNRAKEIMIAAGVPTLPGYNGAAQDDETLRLAAEEIGYPVMIKPVYGGGGKGMRVAYASVDFDDALAAARSESRKAFGDASMIVEKFVADPRHVEVQIFGDAHANYVHLWERDCSVQRRHQKIIEEAPAPGLSDATRHELGARAVDAARAVAYEGAGTVEFVMDRQSGQFFFMEMNTRLQVEHPVTEAITGVDLVEWQFRVANGEPIPLLQCDIPLLGHAMEARIYAEQFDSNSMEFMPCAGKLEYLRFPPAADAFVFRNDDGGSRNLEGVRVDSGVVQGDTVTVHYDPMIAKVIARASTRDEAIARLNAALWSTHIGGVSSNVELVRACLAQADFHAGDVSTGFVDAHRDDLRVALSSQPPRNELSQAAVIDLLLKTLSAKKRTTNDVFAPSKLDFFRVNLSARHRSHLDDSNTLDVEIIDGANRVYRVHNCQSEWVSDVRVDDLTPIEAASNGADTPLAIRFTLHIRETSNGSWLSHKCSAVQLADSIMIWSNGDHGDRFREWPIGRAENRATSSALDADTARLDGRAEARAPIPGVVERVLVRVGERIKKAQTLVIMNAMKMEFVIKAPCDCIVLSVDCQVKDTVGKNAVLIRLDTNINN